MLSATDAASSSRTIPVESAFMKPSRQGIRLRPPSTSLVASSHVLDSMSASATTKTAATTTALTSSFLLEPLSVNGFMVAGDGAAVDPPLVLFLGLLATAFVFAVGPVVLAGATSTRKIEDPPSDEEEFTSSLSHFIPSLSENDINNKNQQEGPSQLRVGMGRRGTIASLIGGAATLAVSDALLGSAGQLLSGSSPSFSSIYGARWNALYQRVATQIGKHGSKAVASPELAAWIAKSPAAWFNPELRAWLAAQRAFSMSRQIVGAAALLEEGIVTAAGATLSAAAAVAGSTSATTTEDIIADDSHQDEHLADVIELDHNASSLETTTISLYDDSNQCGPSNPSSSYENDEAGEHLTNSDK